MIRRTSNSVTPRKRCRGNLRPAPFAITPSVVERVIALTEAPAPRVVHVPLLPVKLVDVPRQWEDPRLSRANDVADDAQLPDEHIKSCVEAVTDTLSDALPEPSPRRRRSDAIFRFSIDQDAKELETPVDKAVRLNLIKRAAASLRFQEAKPEVRALPGIRREAGSRALPPMPMEARRRALDAAMRHLASRGVLVTVLDRFADVRRYRVSGKRDPLLAEDVIALAVEWGMQA